jgi:hypothetical protein
VDEGSAAIAAGAFRAGLALMLGNTVWERRYSVMCRAIRSRAQAPTTGCASFIFDPIGLAIWGPIAELIGITVALWTAFGALLGSGLALFAGRRCFN